MAENGWWSVRLDLPEGYAGPMSGPNEPWVSDRDIRLASFDGFDSESIDAGSGLMMELRAPDAATAQARAHHIAECLAASVGLPAVEFSRVWVAPLDDSEVSSQRFLGEARDLLSEERFELAVVAAQIHLELQVKTLLRRSIRNSALRHLGPLIKKRNIGSLGNEESQIIVEAFLGVEVKQMPEWSDFRRHLDRRNAIVHEGHAVSEVDAAASVEVVRRVWTRLLDGSR
jgi:hypothetical protein